MVTTGFELVTVTVNEQAAVLPDASVAVAVTVVVPIGNTEPDGRLVTTVTPGQLSVAVTAKFTIAVHEADAGTLMFCGQLITGGVLSATVNVVVHWPLLFEASVAVTVIVCVPTPTIVPAAGLCVRVTDPAAEQLSETVTPSSTFGIAAWQLALAEAVVPAGQVIIGA